jgi:hypothetical protein
MGVFYTILERKKMKVRAGIADNQEYQEALSYLLQAVRKTNAADVAGKRDIYDRIVAERSAMDLLSAVIDGHIEQALRAMPESVESQSRPKPYRYR